MSGSKSIVFKYTYATSALKQNKITVFGETATAFVAGQDYDENVIFKIPAVDLSAFVLYYNGVVPSGSVGSTELASLRTGNAGVTNVPVWSITDQYYLGDIVTFTPPGTLNASCYTLVRTTSVSSDPVPTQGTTVVGYTGPVIGQNRYYQAYVQGLPPTEASGVAHKSYWSQSTIASGWSATVPNYAGDRVVYQGNVYQCTTTNGLLDTSLKLVGTFGQGDGSASYGYDTSGIRYILNVLPTNSKFWLYSALPAVPSSTYTYINWAQSEIGGLGANLTGGVLMKWDGTRPADLLPTATSGGILGGSGTVTFTFYTDDELNKVNTLLNLYNQNQNSFSLVKANAILAKLPAAVIKSQTSSTSLEPDQQLAQMVNAGPRFTSPDNYNTVVQSIFEEAVANDMLYTTNADGSRTKLNQLSTHGFPDLLAGLEGVKKGSTNAFAQAKASMGVAGFTILSNGTGYVADTEYTLTFKPPVDENGTVTGVTATAIVRTAVGATTLAGSTITITNAGSGYTSLIEAPTIEAGTTKATFGPPTMRLVGVVMTSFGGFYSSNQAITVSLQNPLTISGGVCSALTTAPKSFAVTTGTTSTIRTTLNSFTLITSGSGYTTVPNVIVSGSTAIGGTLPTFEPLMGVNQISTKTGYTGIPVTDLPLKVAMPFPLSLVCTGVAVTTLVVTFTVSTSTAGLVLGETITTSGFTNTGNNGTFVITSIPSSTQFRCALGTAVVETTPPAAARINKGTRAVANPVFYGSISAISVATPGSGYKQSDTLTISAPYNGVPPVTSTPAMTSGSVTSVDVTTAGTGFYTVPTMLFSAPTIAATATASITETGSVSAISLSAADILAGGSGTGYINAPFVSIAAPSTEQIAILVPVVNEVTGQVTGITILNPGAGYYGAAPTITISGGFAANGTTASSGATTGFPVIVNGSITEVQITAGGSNYSRSSPPTVVIAAPPKSVQAQAIATVSPTTGAVTSVTVVNTVTSIAITNSGNYSGVPNVEIEPPASGTVSNTVVSSGTVTLTLARVKGLDAAIKVGNPITITGAATAANNGTFTIKTVPSTTSVTFINPNGVTMATACNFTVGTAATATAVMSGTSVASLTVTSGGSCYEGNPTVAAIATTGVTQTTAFTATAQTGLGGVGYRTIPSILFIGATSVTRNGQGELVAGSTSPFSAVVKQATGVPVLLNNSIGGIANILITSGGSGYTAPPKVTFIASAGRTAQASLTLNASGGIASVTIIDGGYGYGLGIGGGVSEPITLTLSQLGGSGCTFNTPTVLYTLDRFVYLNNGSGYTTPPATTITTRSDGEYSGTLTLAPRLSVTSIPTYYGVTDVTFTGGRGYTPAQALSVVKNESTAVKFGIDPGVYGTAAVSPIMGGVIQTLAIPGGATGTGYTTATTLTISAPASGQGAPASATVSSVNSVGAITGISMSSGGFGYGFTWDTSLTPPAWRAETITVTISGSGSGATLTVPSLPANILYDIIGVQFQGNSYGEYTSVPTVTMSNNTQASGYPLAVVSSPVAKLGVVPSSTARNASAGIGLYASPQLIFDDPPQATTTRATAAVTNSSVSKILVSVPGSGYDFVPTVTITGYGSGATAAAKMGVTSAFIVSGGVDYKVGNVITLTTPSPVVSGNITAKVVVTQVDVRGTILNTYISEPGLGYTTMPTFASLAQGTALTAAAGTGADIQYYLGVVSVQILTPGNSYSGIPSVVFQSPSFTSSTASATAKTARITPTTGLTLTSGGSGYTLHQKCRLLGGLTHTAPVTEDFGYIRVTGVTGGSISSFAVGGSIGTVTITNGGSGYTPNATNIGVSFLGGGISPTPATATATANSSGVITNIVFAANATSYGSGYTGIPTVVIDVPTAGIRATAVATLDGGFDYRPGDVLVVEGGIGGTVTVASVTNNIADPRDVKVTEFGSGFVSVPKIKVYGGAQGIVLATSLKLNGVQIPKETYLNNGLYRNGDGVFADIPGSGVVRVGSLANAGTTEPTVVMTNRLENLSSYPDVSVVGSGTGAGLAAVATALVTPLSATYRGKVDSVTIGASIEIGTIVSTAASVASGSPSVTTQALTFDPFNAAAANLQLGMFLTLASAVGSINSTNLGPYKITAINSGTKTVSIENVGGTVGSSISVAARTVGGAYYQSSNPPSITFPLPPTAVRAVGVPTVNANGTITIAVTVAGNGYSAPPSVTVTPSTADSPTPTVTSVTATLNDAGGVASITVVGSANFLNPPTVEIAPPEPSRQAIGVPIISDVGGVGSRITGINVSDGGSGYPSGVPLTVTIGTPSLGSIIARADCGLSSVQITTSVTGFIGNASVFTEAPSGPLLDPKQALIIPLKFREITGINNVTNVGVYGTTGVSSGTYTYASGVFPQVAITAPSLSSTASEVGSDATQLISGSTSNGVSFILPQFQGWYGINFNPGDTFQFLVKYTIAKAVVFEVDTDATIPGLTRASTSITIGGVTIPLYNPSTGTGVGRELSTNAVVHTYMVTLKAS